MLVEDTASADAALACIEQGRRLTAAMIQSAESGDWDEVGRLDQARRPVLRSLALAGLEAAAVTPVGEALRALVALNGYLVELAGRQRQHRLDALRSARGAIRGSSVYRKLASDR